MRDTTIMAFLSVLMLVAPAEAALPPAFQRQAELRRIVDEIPPAFGAMRPIDRIEYLGPDLYRVSSGSCHMDVRIEDAPGTRKPKTVGPRKFRLVQGPVLC